MEIKTLYVQTESWFLGVNVQSKPRIFMSYAGGVGRYSQICDEIAAAGYASFLRA